MNFINLFKKIYNETGIVFTQNEDIVQKKIIRFFESKGFTTLNDFEQSINNNSLLYQELINLITTSETYFYREFSQIEFCIQKVKELNRKVKILSAPCASGEEPYSILIALLEAGVDLKNIEIYGVDINSDEINRAKKGLFKSRRLYRLSQTIIEKYFTKEEDDNYRITLDLQQDINFIQLNLFEPLPAQLNNFDIIFSRNMLIYFDKEAKLKIEKIFYDKLVKGGVLLLGHADIIENRCGFTKELNHQVSYYFK